MEILQDILNKLSFFHKINPILSIPTLVCFSYDFLQYIQNLYTRSYIYIYSASFMFICDNLLFPKVLLSSESTFLYFLIFSISEHNFRYKVINSFK